MNLPLLIGKGIDPVIKDPAGILAGGCSFRSLKPGWTDRELLEKLVDRLEKIVDKTEDSVTIYPLCGSCARCSEDLT